MNEKLIKDIYYPSTSPRRFYIYRPEPPKTPLRETALPEPLPSPKRRRKLAVSAVLVTVLSAGALVGFNKFGSGPVETVANAVPAVQAVFEEPKPAPPTPVNTIALKQQVDDIIAKYPDLQISVAYKDLKTQAKLSSGVAEPYLAASTIKVMVAALFLHQVEAGKYTLDQQSDGSSAQTKLQRLIEDSDNNAWGYFKQLLGGTALKNYSIEIGMQNYDFLRNTSTPSDIAVLLEKLYNRQLLNEQNTSLLLSYMQKASENQYIRAAVPENFVVYHKAGWLEDRAHDSAIIEADKRSFILVIFTKANSGSYDFTKGAQIIREITAAFTAVHQSL